MDKRTTAVVSGAMLASIGTIGLMMGSAQGFAWSPFVAAIPALPIGLGMIAGPSIRRAAHRRQPARVLTRLAAAGPGLLAMSLIALPFALASGMRWSPVTAVALAMPAGLVLSLIRLPAVRRPAGWGLIVIGSVALLFSLWVNFDVSLRPSAYEAGLPGGLTTVPWASLAAMIVGALCVAPLDMEIRLPRFATRGLGANA